MEAFFDFCVKILAGFLVLFTFKEKLYPSVNKLFIAKIQQPHIDLNMRCDEYDKRCIELTKVIDILMHGQKAILHDRIYGACRFYIDEQGYISLDDLENLDILYKSYIALHGNGLCKKLYGQVCELKHEKEV